MLAGMSKDPEPRYPDRRLRVMLRFVDFCMARIDLLIYGRSSPQPENDPYRSFRISAAIRITLAVTKLLAYLSSPFAPRSTKSMGKGHDQASDLASVNRVQGHQSSSIDVDDGGYIVMAKKIVRKIRTMIKRDQQLRFGQGAASVRSEQKQHTRQAGTDLYGLFASTAKCKSSLPGSAGDLLAPALLARAGLRTPP